MKIQECVDDLVMRGCDDWVQASEVASVAITEGGARSEKEIQDLSFEMTRRVIRDGLMVLGDVTEKGFKKWNLSSEEGLARAERDWRALGRTPNLGELFWLENTPKGKKLGEALHKKRKSGR